MSQVEALSPRSQDIVKKLEEALKLQAVVFCAITNGNTPLNDQWLPTRAYLEAFNKELLRMAFFADALSQARPELPEDREIAWVDETKNAIKRMGTRNPHVRGHEKSMLYVPEHAALQREAFQDLSCLVIGNSAEVNVVEGGVEYANAVANELITIYEKDQLRLF